jgi:transposase
LLLDESGLLMAPLLRRSWALRGEPPVSKHKAAHREKVSVAAAVWLPPLRDRLHLAYQTLVNGYFTNVEVAEFLGQALELPYPLIALWDGGTMHKGGPIHDLVEQSAGRLDIEPLPANAPELMPVEPLWRWLKYDRLCNFTPRDARHLNEAVAREVEAVREDQELLRSFFESLASKEATGRLDGWGKAQKYRVQTLLPPDHSRRQHKTRAFSSYPVRDRFRV